MALLGTGVLAIWNGIAASAEDEFVDWHVREHIPERVGLPGFLRGRRYVAVDGFPKYFNFYETAGPGVLSSDAYQARLNAPTEWTRRVVTHFTDTSRTACEVAASFGRGEGALIDTIRLSASNDPTTFKAAVAEKILRPVAGEPGIVGAYLLQGQKAARTTRSGRGLGRADRGRRTGEHRSDPPQRCKQRRFHSARRKTCDRTRPVSAAIRADKDGNELRALNCPLPPVQIAKILPTAMGATMLSP